MQYKKKTLTVIIRLLLFLSGGALVVEAILASFARNFNLGIAMPFIIGLPLVILALFFEPLIKLCRSKKLFRFLGIAFIACYLLFALLFTATTSAILLNSRTPKDISPNAIIVLGAATRGDAPSVQLSLRLKKALEYYNEHNGAYLIVSGAKGADEEYSEAFVMKKWLVSHGVEPDKIIEEDRATSTEENFIFSNEIIQKLIEDGRLSEDGDMVFVTNRFHVFRAERLASHLGINAQGIASGEYRKYLLNDYLRECAAITEHFFKGKL